MKRYLKNFVVGLIAMLLVVGLLPTHTVAEEDSSLPLRDELEMDESSVSQEDDSEGEDSPEEELPDESETESLTEEEEEEKPERMLMVSDTPLTVKNVLYFEFDYYCTEVECWSEDPEIIQISQQHVGYDEEIGGIAGITVYGIADGTTEIVVTGGGEEVRRSVTVQKPTEDTGKQRLIDHMLVYGQTNELGDKLLVKEIPEWETVVLVEYDCWDHVINFSYEEITPEGKIQWYMMPTEKDNSEYYITMHIGEEFLTATVDLLTYDGEELEFEKGWYRVPAEEEIQEQANMIAPFAFETLKEFLYEETGMVPGDIYRTFEIPEAPEMG